MADGQTIPSAIRRLLPRSRLFWVRWRRTRIVSLGSRRVWRAKFRNANAMFVWLGPLEIGWRMPWLPRSASALYPHLFVTPPFIADERDGTNLRQLTQHALCHGPDGQGFNCIPHSEITSRKGQPHHGE